MLSSIILAFLLLAILSFLKLVALRSAACEAGPAPYTPDSEAWSAELDVARGCGRSVGHGADGPRMGPLSPLRGVDAAC